MFFCEKRILVLVVCALSAAIQAQSIRLETLDADIEGTLLEIDTANVTIDQGYAPKIFPLTEIIAIRQLVADSSIRSIAESSLGRIELLDGSQFPYNAWEQNEDGLQYVLLNKRDGRTRYKITTDLGSIHSWRLARQSSAEEIAQWEVIVSTARSADLLVVRREEKMLDYVEGAIESIDAGGVRFALQGEVVPAPWEKLYGLVFTRPQAEQPNSEFVVHGVSGLMLQANNISSVGTSLRIVDDDAFQADLEFNSLDWIDLSTDKLTYLSDLEVIESDWQPALTGLYLPGEPRFDRSYDGNMIHLRFPDSRMSGVWKSQEYARGLAIRSKTRLVLRLPDDAAWLKGWLGIDPSVAATGAATVRILADEEVLAEYEVDGQSVPEDINIALPDADALTLEVGYGDNFDTGDVIHFADARVTK